MKKTIHGEQYLRAAAMICSCFQRLKREQKEQQEKELLEKRQQFKEATKNLLVFTPEELAPKEKPSKGRKVNLKLFNRLFLFDSFDWVYFVCFYIVCWRCGTKSI